MPSPFSDVLIVRLYRQATTKRFAAASWYHWQHISHLSGYTFPEFLLFLWTSRLFGVGKRWAICLPRGKTGSGYGRLTQWQDMCIGCTDFSIVGEPLTFLVQALAA